MTSESYVVTWTVTETTVYRARMTREDFFLVSTDARDVPEIILSPDAGQHLGLFEDADNRVRVPQHQPPYRTFVDITGGDHEHY